ncbi:hypothetical protein BC829DRAFT_402338 [Chytridium lagenaria]|nr:hypothetical protein BC829DRAFT_402338 [Chytridium lagenaria]
MPSTVNITCTGATGKVFIGGEILSQVLHHRSQGEPWSIHCIIRDDATATKSTHLKSLGVDRITVFESLDDVDTLSAALHDTDILLHGADGSDHPESAKAILRGLTVAKKNGRLGWFIHTSGVGVVMDDGWGGVEEVGMWPDKVFRDDDPDSVNALPDSQPHRDVDLIVSDPESEAALCGVKTVIVVPPLVYGVATGQWKKTSSQVPRLIELAIRRKNAVFCGTGKARWSHVHVKVSYLFPESGCHEWADLSHAIASVLHARGLVHSPDAMSCAREPELSECFKSAMSRRYYTSNAVTSAVRLREWGWRNVEMRIEESLEIQG